MTRPAEPVANGSWVVIAQSGSRPEAELTGMDEEPLRHVAELAGGLVEDGVARLLVPVSSLAPTLATSAPPQTAGAVETLLSAHVLNTSPGEIFEADEPARDARLELNGHGPFPGAIRYVAGAPVRLADGTDGALVLTSYASNQSLGETGTRRLLKIAGLAGSLLGLQEEAAARASEAETARLLQRELNHRVRNSLAVLQSIAGQTLRHAPDAESFMTTFTGRLRALAEAHTMLSEKEWGNVGLASIIDNLILPFATEDGQIDMQGEPVGLPPDQAIGLSFVFHELATNAATHGALSVLEGEIGLVWYVDRDPDPVLHIEWREKDGPRVTAPARDGFGLVMVRHSLDKVLGARVSVMFPPGGLVAQIRLPLTLERREEPFT